MKPSLSASALKYLALFTMLLDHMAYYLYLPEPLRWVGRLAAPIFLFFVVEGFGRTRNYKKYLLRVYAVAAGMGITNALLRQYAGGLRPDGITPTNGICATFFLLLVILQGLKRMEQRRWDGILLVAGPFVLPLLLEAVLPTAAASLLTTTLLPSPYTCEGGIEFLMIGVLLYFFRRERSMQLTAYVVSCLVLYLTPILLLNGSPVTLLFTYYQWMMVFAAIPLAMYNGERGNSPRWLFYWFYPAHVSLLGAGGAVLVGVCRVRAGAGGPPARRLRRRSGLRPLARPLGGRPAARSCLQRKPENPAKTKSTPSPCAGGETTALIVNQINILVDN